MSFYILGRKYTTDEIERRKKDTFKKQLSYTLTNVKKQKSIESQDVDPFFCAKNTPEHYKCYYCDFKTYLKVEYNKHVVKTRLKPTKNFNIFVSTYTCDKCNFQTFSRLILLKHAYMNCAVTNGMMVFACCKDNLGPYKHIKLLVDQSHLKIKLPSCTGTRSLCLSNKLFVCEECPFETLKKRRLEEHVISRHTAEKDINWFECEQCPYRAKFHHALNKHRCKYHTVPEKKVWFKCSDCSYRSSWRADYRKHCRNVHSLTNWYECDKCPLRTRYSSHFKRHIREQHSDNFKWLQCEHCPYKAKQKVHMGLHVVQKHTAIEEIKWYECEKCTYKAKLKASLKNHILKKHTTSEQTNWLVCEKCGHKVKGRFMLKRHFDKKHK